MQVLISRLLPSTVAWLCICMQLTGASSLDLLPLSRTAISGKEVHSPEEILDWQPSIVDPGRWEQPTTDNVFWVRLDSLEFEPDDILWVRGQRSVSAWVYTPGNVQTVRFGFNEPLHRLPFRGVDGILPVSSLPKGTQQIVLRIVPFSQQPWPVRVKRLSSEEFSDQQMHLRGDRLAYHLFLGAGVIALLFLAGFVTFLFFENSKKEYLYYGLYMLCMVLYFVRLLEYHFEVPVFWGFFYEGYGLAEILALMISYVMYVQFVRYFLGLDAAMPRLLIFIRGWIALCLFFGSVGLLLSLFRISSALFLEIYLLIRFAMPAFVIFFMWRVYRAHLEYANYVILGTGFLLIGGLAALLVTIAIPGPKGSVLTEPMFYMLSGVFLESFCFALGLGKQARQTELDKLAAQQEVLLKVQREAQLEKDILASQVQTLRAQMNPHFIFNALNSIQHFILSNQKEMSVKYLSRVSQLIRRILHNSTTQNITLDEELETLKSYVEIEQLRFHPAFEFKYSISEYLDAEILRIPHLMIQPFIENAILHGLIHRKEPGELSLDIRERDEYSVEVVITDNGIGREEAGKIVRQKPQKHNSISIASIAARIKLLLPDIQEPVVIEDLEDENGAAAGTQVRLIIPIV